MGTPLLVKADLGTKRGCPSCNARFYDLEKRPIECPKCGFTYEPEALFKQRRRQPEPAGPVRAAESDDEEDEDEDENDAGEIEDIEVEDDEDEEDNDLLSEVEDEEDDVSGIIDPGIAKDEA